MPSSRSSSKSLQQQQQHRGTSTSATVSPNSLGRKRARRDDGMSTSTTPSHAPLNAAQAQRSTKGGLRHSSEDGQRTATTPAPSLDASSHYSNAPPGRRPRKAGTGDSNPTLHTASEESSMDGHPRLSALGAPPTRGVGVEEPAAHAPASSFSGTIARANSNGRREFVVMINHKRITVPAEHPLLRPCDLFAPRATKTVAEDSRQAAGADEADDCVAAAEEAASRPLHCYGDRPVLLLDCTGALRQRRQRRQRRQELQSRASQLAAERADLLRTQSLWSTRLTRARRQSKQPTAPAAAVDDVGGAPDKFGGDSAGSESCDAAVGCASMKHLLSELSHRRKSNTCEMKEVRDELLALLQQKREQASTRDGCVLMLPSPETGEVRLLPGHHYRTVCFVGDELCEVLPSDSRDRNVAPLRRRQHRAPPLRASASEGIARVLSESDEDGAESERALAKANTRPLWAKAELLGYALYLRQCRRNPQYRSCRGATLDADRTVDQELRDGCTDVGKIAATISYDMVDNYFALPSCEMAMYREWATDKLKGPALQ
ncbi:hypothetical protein LSCM1_07063 [Leishmania martiniquensis]|uniref:Uncharacterized protein n=1 Tax=Leishmania martiniquensis TaxID=1580590 RepID=A0A836KRP6_9TRYP|nr:hypothetical protein LSCM1_07063 [Leishmania martiniquensis]